MTSDTVAGLRARVEISRGSGTQFDPAVVAAYETIGDDAFARLGEGVRPSGGRSSR